MRHHHLYHLLAAVVLLTAIDSHAAPQTVHPPAFTPAPARQFDLPAIRANTSTFGPAAGSVALDAQRGGTDTVNNNMALDGSVHSNVANNVVTGSNTIDAGSFANMSGIPTVIQNTGANVLIQNATIINLQFK